MQKHPNTPAPNGTSPPAGPQAPPPPEQNSQSEDQRLDEELDETFPASDPIPYRHDK
jgi:hypothetical protein